MRVAVIHDWLGPMTGAERVLEQLLICYPGADVYTAVDFLAPEHRQVLRGSRVFPSFVQRMPRASSNIWNYAPLMPFAMEQFDLAPYDLILSNSHAVAKGVRPHPHQVHVCYLLSPMRFIWDQQSYYLETYRLQSGIKSALARVMFYGLRQWDVQSAARVDAFVSCSAYVQRRAQICYRRESEVLHPPVDLDFFTPGGTRGAHYLAASRLTPFKRIGAIVEAFRQLPHATLHVIGDGPEREAIQRLAGPNVVMRSRVSDEALRDEMRRARAFLFAAPEDFGLVMVEAQACGTPVIALSEGGAVEIVIGGAEPTGVFFDDASPTSIADAVRQFEAMPEIPADRCAANAQRFRPEPFRERLVGLVDAAVARYGRLRTPIA